MFSTATDTRAANLRHWAAGHSDDYLRGFLARTAGETGREATLFRLVVESILTERANRAAVDALTAAVYA